MEKEVRSREVGSGEGGREQGGRLGVRREVGNRGAKIRGKGRGQEGRMVREGCWEVGSSSSF